MGTLLNGEARLYPFAPVFCWYSFVLLSGKRSTDRVKYFLQQPKNSGQGLNPDHSDDRKNPCRVCLEFATQVIVAVTVQHMHL